MKNIGKIAYAALVVLVVALIIIGKSLSNM